MKKFLSIITFVLVATAANAAGIAVQGAGTSTCAKFAKDYQADPEVWESTYFTWAQGFMSGVNFQRIMASEDSRDISPETIEAQKFFIRNYCDKHPLETYLQAVTSLYGTLPFNKASK